MPGAADFLLFVGAALALIVVPGPSVLYVVTRSVEHGRRVGIASVLGVGVGGIGHVVAAAVGLSALLVRSSAVFTAVRLAGAAYLVVLGLRRLLDRGTVDADEVARRSVTAAVAFRQGAFVQLLNPKTALFFLAFLPQFVDPERGSVLLQTIVLGLTFIVLALLSDGTYAMVAGSLAGKLRSRVGRSSTGMRATGLVYVGLGLSAALTRKPAN